MHFLRNALDYLPRKGDEDCLTELHWIYQRRSLEEARRDLAAWLGKWGARYPKLCDWVEDNIEATLSFYRLPQSHHRQLKSTNMLERLMEQLKRRTLEVRIFPNPASCLRLPRALAVELHENWIEATRYLDMERSRNSERRRCAPLRRLNPSDAEGRAWPLPLHPLPESGRGAQSHAIAPRLALCDPSGTGQGQCASYGWSTVTKFP